MASGVGKLFQWRPEIPQFLAPLRMSVIPRLELERFRVGIDNLHIDVSLSLKFHAALSTLVQKMVMEDLARQGYSEMGKPPTKQDFDNFRAAYRGLLESALERVEGTGGIEDQVQLLQLALLKRLLESPAEVLAQMRSQLQQSADSPTRDQEGRSLELHDRKVALAKHEPGVRYRTLRRLFKAVRRMESKELRKVRKSVLGKSWVLPKSLLFNPLLHLPDLTTESYLMNHYPIICTDRGDERYFVTTNRIFCELFADYLPAWAMPAGETSADKSAEQGFKIRQREWRGGFSGFLDGQRLLEQALQEEEFKGCLTSWLDTPTNIDLLFPKSATSRGLFGLRKSGQGGPWDHPDGRGFQQQMAGELHRRLQKAGIIRRAIAAYRTPRLFRQLNERVAIQDIYRYLAGDLPRRQLVKHLAVLPQEQADEAMRALDTLVHYLKRLPSSKLEEYGNRYIRDFLCFRHDLKLAYFTHQQMGNLRLLRESEDIKLSRENGSLYEFRLLAETDSSKRRIRAHVVLKADVRGSTEITHQLMAQRLNPATHFSHNFFGPITKLLSRFGAQKVFVEGDALILTVLEYGGIGSQSMTVANACGLARKIISVMESQNVQNRLHNLPELELGLGIAFSNDAPAYLYDDQRRIMISPAINHADRLSSCSAELRRNTRWKRSKRHCVEVMRREDDGATTGNLQRYNVNGINLDANAFNKLNAELALRKVRLHSRSGKIHHYHVGRFVDREGTSHWLVVRQASVKLLRDGEVVAPEQGGQYFYEVITDAGLIGRVKAKLNQAPQAKA